MKNKINLILTLFITTVVIYSCKKKEETPTVKEPTVQHYVMKAQVDGNVWAVTDKSSHSKFGNTYSFNSQTDYSTPYSAMGVGFTYTTGVVSLQKFGAFSAYYRDLNGTNYPAISGTLNISQIDTLGSFNLLSKLKATFSFITDTVAGKSYTITEGVIDYTKN